MDSNCCLEMLILVIGTVVVRSGMYLASVDGGQHSCSCGLLCVCVGGLNSMDKVLRMLAFYLCVVLNFFGIGKFCFVSLFHMPSIFVRLCLWNVVPTPLRSECYKGCRPHTPFASRYGGYGTFGA